MTERITGGDGTIGISQEIPKQNLQITQVISLESIGVDKEVGEGWQTVEIVKDLPEIPQGDARGVTRMFGSDVGVEDIQIDLAKFPHFSNFAAFHSRLDITKSQDGKISINIIGLQGSIKVDGENSRYEEVPIELGKTKIALLDLDGETIFECTVDVIDESSTWERYRVATQVDVNKGLLNKNGLRAKVGDEVFDTTITVYKRQLVMKGKLKT